MQMHHNSTSNNESVYTYTHKYIYCYDFKSHMKKLKYLGVIHIAL